MGMRLKLRIYKGCDAAAFRGYAEQAVLAVGGRGIEWGRPGTETDQDCDLRLAQAGDVHSLYVPYQGSDYSFCKKIGELGGLIWIEARIQEGSHWDYTLHSGGEVADQFSTDPDYYHEKDEQAHARLAGDPAKLATLWGIPVKRIERYLRHWGPKDNDDGTYDYTLTGKAYPEDEADYGQYAQILDFVHALGGSNPQEEHTIHLPMPEWKQKLLRRPWWRFWR